MSKRVTKLRLPVIALVMVLVLASGIIGCSGENDEEPEGTLTVYLAGSLSVPFEQLKTLYEEEHPNVDVLLESGGSAAMISKAIAKQDAGEDPPDIMASADYALIPSRMYRG